MNVFGILWRGTLFFFSPAVVSQFTSLVFHLENKLKIKFDNYLIKPDVESHFFAGTVVLSTAGICSLDLGTYENMPLCVFRHLI